MERQQWRDTRVRGEEVYGKSRKKHRNGNRLCLWNDDFAESKSMNKRCIISCWCFVSSAPNQLALCCAHHPNSYWCHHKESNATNDFHKTIAIHTKKTKEQLIEIIAAVDFVFVLLFIVLSSIWLFNRFVCVCVCAFWCAFETCWLIEGSCNSQFHAKKNYCHFYPSISLFCSCSFSLNIYALFVSFTISATVSSPL